MWRGVLASAPPVISNRHVYPAGNGGGVITRECVDGSNDCQGALINLDLTGDGVKTKGCDSKGGRRQRWRYRQQVV